MPDGKTRRFIIHEAPLLSPELAQRHPEVKTFAGFAVDDRGTTVRLDREPSGYHAIVISVGTSTYVDPLTSASPGVYVSYNARDPGLQREVFHCEVNTLNQASRPGSSDTIPTNYSRGALTRTFRLAVAATAEYSAAVSTLQGHQPNKRDAFNAIVTTINRVDGIYEKELGIRLVLVSDEDKVIYTDPNTEPYTNADPDSLLSQNQSNLDQVIGSDKYDIGHVFSTGGGGKALVGCVCIDGSKGQGETGSAQPVGKPFDVDYVAHEMGHQFGATHTFAAVSGSCGMGNRSDSTAYEPGSGSTIMGYAGICGPSDNLQYHSDEYFHFCSLWQISQYLADHGCSQQTGTAATAPAVDPGASIVVPKGTPFYLMGVGSPASSGSLLYCWEQADVGDGPAGALLRSISPSTSPLREFPTTDAILDPTGTVGLVLPTAARTMSFRLTVRDTHGGFSFAPAQVDVDEASGPFSLTKPDSGSSWPHSSQQSVTWDPAHTDSGRINCHTVDIVLSFDGGKTYPVKLATGVQNSGTATVQIPALPTGVRSVDNARVRINAVGAQFFAVSPAFSIR